MDNKSIVQFTFSFNISFTDSMKSIFRLWSFDIHKFWAIFLFDFPLLIYIYNNWKLCIYYIRSIQSRRFYVAIIHPVATNLLSVRFSPFCYSIIINSVGHRKTIKKKENPFQCSMGIIERLMAFGGPDVQTQNVIKSQKVSEALLFFSCSVHTFFCYCYFLPLTDALVKECR